MLWSMNTNCDNTTATGTQNNNLILLMVKSGAQRQFREVLLNEAQCYTLLRQRLPKIYLLAVSSGTYSIVGKRIIDLYKDIFVIIIL